MLQEHAPLRIAGAVQEFLDFRRRLLWPGAFPGGLKAITDVVHKHSLRSRQRLIHGGNYVTHRSVPRGDQSSAENRSSSGGLSAAACASSRRGPPYRLGKPTVLRLARRWLTAAPPSAPPVRIPRLPVAAWVFRACRPSPGQAARPRPAAER